MIRIAVFASGSGTNFQAIADAFTRGELNGIPAVCVCDKPGAPVCDRARKAGIPLIEASPKDFSCKEMYEKFLADKLQELDIDLICLAGYMRIIGPVLLQRFDRRIINIHPSLLPAFKGAHAIKDAFEYGVRIFGVTIHFVNSELDGGEIIDQQCIRYEGHDLNELESKIHDVEHQLYPPTINKVINLLINKK